MRWGHECAEGMGWSIAWVGKRACMDWSAGIGWSLIRLWTWVWQRIRAMGLGIGREFDPWERGFIPGSNVENCASWELGHNAQVIAL